MRWLLELIRPYLTVVMVSVSVFLFGYIGYMNWRVHSLKEDKVNLIADKAQLTVDLRVTKKQIDVLVAREKTSLEREAKYSELIRGMKGKENGKVSDVLRYAIDSDIVQ